MWRRNIPTSNIKGEKKKQESKQHSHIHYHPNCLKTVVCWIFWLKNYSCSFMKRLRFWEFGFFLCGRKTGFGSSFSFTVAVVPVLYVETKQRLFPPWGLNLQLRAEAQPASLNSRLWGPVRLFSQHRLSFILLDPQRNMIAFVLL